MARGNDGEAAHVLLLDRYGLGGELFTYAVQGLTGENLRARPGPGKWSLGEVIGHLVDDELVATDRMKRVLAEEEPALLNFDETAWGARLYGHDWPVADAVSLFVATRRWTESMLRSCVPADFARSGVHSESGRKTLADLVAGQVGHLDHHLKFLYAKRANLGIALYPRYSAD